MNQLDFDLAHNPSDTQRKDIDLQWMQQSIYPLLVVASSLAIAAIAMPGDLVKLDWLKQVASTEFTDVAHSQEIHTLHLD